MKKSVRRLCTCVLCLLICLPVLPVSAYGGNDITAAANGVLRWKRAQNGTSSGRLFTESFAKTAGDGCDWYMIAAGRYGITDDRAAYLKHIGAYITEKYKTADRLDRRKATEWHRITLAVLAAGGDPRSIGMDENGSPVNLVADGVYNRGYTASLGKQGLNGWIWGLVTLDSKQYAVPSGSFYTREAILKEILSYQLPDGGFSFAGSISDCDTTAAALIALAPYVSTGRKYTYTLKQGKQEVTRTAAQAAEAAAARLSELQLSSGGFTASGEETSESISQVIVALCSLGIDPQGDKRFIKNGSSPVDALMSFQQGDGGFAHLRGEGSDSMAGEQALCALVSLYRLYNGMARLYDYTDGVTMKAVSSGGTSSDTGSGADKKPSPDSGSSGQSGGPSVGAAQTQQGGASGSAELRESSSTVNGSSSSSPQGASSKGEASAGKETGSGSGSSSQAVRANAGAQASSQTGGEKVPGETPEEGNGINPIIFVIIGAALIAGGLGFHFAKMRSGKVQGKEEDDFFASLKTYREEHPEEEPGGTIEENPAGEDKHEAP